MHSDFSNYYVSARLIADGRSVDKLYDNTWFRNTAATDYGVTEPGKFSPFPPLTAWWMLPLTGLDVLDAQRVFVLINIVFLFAGVVIVSHITKWSFRLALLLVLASGLSLANNVAFGQMYWLMTVAILFACKELRSHRAISAAGLLSLFTALKYFPVVIAAGQFFKSPRDSVRFIIFFSVGLALLLAAQFGYFGGSLMHSFFVSSFLPHLGGDLADQNVYSLYFQSWDNLFRNVFVFHPEFNPHPLMDWAPGRSVMKGLVYMLVATSAAWLLFRFRSEKEEKKFVVYLAVPCLAAMTVLPATASYHFILLVVPVTLLVSIPLLTRSSRRLLLCVYALIGFIPYSFFFDLAKSAGLWLGYPRLFLVSTIYVITFLGLMKRSDEV